MQHAHVDQELGTNIDHRITKYKGQCGAQCLQEHKAEVPPAAIFLLP
jgi:hypothetical protein